MKQCPNGHSIDDNAKFCPQCGAEIIGAVYCAKCGKELEGTVKFCPQCGTPIGEISRSSDNEMDNSDVYEPPTKKHKKWGVIAAITATIVLLGGAAWYFLANKKDYSLEGLAKATINYDYIYNFHDGRALVVKGDKHGYIDKMGNEVIPCIYDYYLEEGYCDSGFREGFAYVHKGGNGFFIDTDGKEPFHLNYSLLAGFSEGLAHVFRDGWNGFIDKNGNEIISLLDNYSCESSFSEGLVAIEVDGRYGYFDKKGNWAIPPVLEYETNEIDCMVHIPDFHDGFAVAYKNGKYGYIDKKGNEIIPCIYDHAAPFSDGMAVVEKDGKYGFVDKNGKEVISCSFDYANSFSEGLASVQEGEQDYVIDKNGKEVFSLSSYSRGYGFVSFHEGLAVVYKSVEGGSFVSGFIDTSGKEVIPCIYTNCYPEFSEGLAVVEKDGIYGFVDKEGNSTFDIQDEEVRRIVQTKIQEKEEQKRIEEERRAEEERRRLQELAKPSNMFYNLANQKQHKWIARSIFRGMETYYDYDRRGDFPRIVFLYFYPSSKTSGLVTVVYFTDNYKEYSTSYMCRVPYVIQDDIIIFTAKYRPWRHSQTDEFMLKILPTDCERLLRVNANTPQVFEMITNDMEDPSWRYRL